MPHVSLSCASNRLCTAQPDDSSLVRSVLVRVLAGMLVSLALAATAAAQVPYLTAQGDNARTGANVNETLLTPANVNKNSFGKLFNYPVDYQVLAQPLYVPNVNIPGLGVHNVVYVATMNDSVYAFDADSNEGTNALPLWHVNFLDPANGITVASADTGTLPCTTTKDSGPGFHMEGVVSTPVIDLNAGAAGVMYLVAKTLENGVVRHRLHAIDITNGQDEPGSPVLISATSTSNKGHVVNFNSLHQKNRPGLLLNNGILYLGFGSNFCNDANSGWVLSYDQSSLTQLGVFNANPDHGLTSIWQSGHGLPADDQGFVYAETAEGNFDLDKGGQGYTDSVLKLAGNPLALADFFTPSNVVAINKKDQDLSSSGVVIVPDQAGATPHELVAAGKQGTIYLINRDNMGQYSTVGDQVVQEFPFAMGEYFGAPAYWNGMLYFNSASNPIRVYSLLNGSLAAVGTTAQLLTGGHSPTVSANGNTNGVLWAVGGTALFAFDAITLNEIYASSQVQSRDQLPATAHFSTQTVANGRVYVATKNSLEVYGLLDSLGVSAGANQSAPVATPVAIQIQATSFYSHQEVVGVSVTFSDGGKGGSFTPATATTDGNGLASTSYTLPKKIGTYTITATAPGFLNTTTAETAVPGPPVKVAVYGGSQQTAPAGTLLPKPLVAQVQDAFKNGVPGVTVSFTDSGKGGALSPVSAVSDVNGRVSVTYQLPPNPGKYTVVESAPGLTTVNKFVETATAGAAHVTVVSGDSQSANAGSALAQPLAVNVTDPSGTPVPRAYVTFSAPTGTFTGNPALTDASGNASVTYTTSTTAGPVTITASSGSGSTQFHETANAGPAVSVNVSGGNNQAAAAGTQLPQSLTVAVADQYANPVAGVSVTFGDAGAGGQFLGSNPATTDNTGTAAQSYLLPGTAGVVGITATAAGVSSPAAFTETAQ